MTNLNIQLLDTGEDFILVSADIETEIKRRFGNKPVKLIMMTYTI